MIPESSQPNDCCTSEPAPSPIQTTRPEPSLVCRWIGQQRVAYLPYSPERVRTTASLLGERELPTWCGASRP